MFSQNCWDVKNEVFEKKIAFVVFVFFMLLKVKQKKEKSKWERAPNPIKIVFLEVVIQKWEKWKNGLVAKIAWHYLCWEGRKKAVFVHTICFGQKLFGPKQSKPGKTIIKIVASAETAQNQNDTYFWKRFFGMGESVCVCFKLCFWKAVFSWKHILIAFSAKHSSCNKKRWML